MHLVVIAGWMLTTLNMGGLATQLGAAPDPPFDESTNVIQFPIDYVRQIYKAHVNDITTFVNDHNGQVSRVSAN